MREQTWLHSPALDLMVGCGGWSLPLLLLAYPFGSGALPAWTALFYALALLLNYPHYMATIYRAYHTKGDFDRYRFYTKTLTVLLIAALFAAHTFYQLVPWLFTIYITWSPWHYMGQNYGLLTMFIRRNGVELDRKDRNALWTAFVASYGMIFLSFHTNASTDPYVLSLGLHPLFDLARIPLLAIFLLLGIIPLAKLTRRAGWRVMLAPIILYATEFLWFVLPTVIELIANVRPPQTRYSAGILAAMHSAQYLWITSYYARREAEADRRLSWKPAAYFAALALGGIALFAPVPWLASWGGHRDFTASVLIVTALVNIHHFILDGAVWKLREPRVAAVLIAEGKKSGGTPVKPWRWPAWTRPAWVKWAVAALLLILAGVDQIRYFLSLPGRDSSTLARAASLNPHDAALQSRLGRAYVLSGDSAAAARAFEEAIRGNPGYAPPYLYLGNVTELRGDAASARRHYQRCIEAAQSYGDHLIEAACRAKLQEPAAP